MLRALNKKCGLVRACSADSWARSASRRSSSSALERAPPIVDALERRRGDEQGHGHDHGDPQHLRAAGGDVRDPPDRGVEAHRELGRDDHRDCDGPAAGDPPQRPTATDEHRREHQVEQPAGEQRTRTMIVALKANVRASSAKLERPSAPSIAVRAAGTNATIHASSRRSSAHARRRVRSDELRLPTCGRG
ncbi:hypothetical protein OV079_51630 [Nannocystis pusilla]|uniref:Uncharacterized protein n=1 Tax=Nannocystis pusilla TaxID=889268 RepID=A0A9X3J588_9BACT|nr:hypothetical protein [Nannocystis pusilla]MCY1013843.1 hypothetical protein [Nannocystis pusilla]